MSFEDQDLREQRYLATGRSLSGCVVC